LKRVWSSRDEGVAGVRRLCVVLRRVRVCAAAGGATEKVRSRHAAAVAMSGFTVAVLRDWCWVRAVGRPGFVCYNVAEGEE
jgi:hypothetical protein